MEFRIFTQLKKDTDKAAVENLVKSLRKIEERVNFQSRVEEEKEDSSQSDKKKGDRMGISVILADHNGMIHQFNKCTPKMFHVSEELLKGKNFFKLMSAYSRRYCYETYGSSIFKTFKQTTKHLRYSLPHMDDVDAENFFVLTSKICLVKPKANSKVKDGKYMIRINTRPSSKASKDSFYKAYYTARKQIREEEGNQPHYLDIEPPFVAPYSNMEGTRHA